MRVFRFPGLPAGVLFLAYAAFAQPATFPSPLVDSKRVETGRQTAVLAGGCFWCVEAVFEQLEGVEKAVAGFAGDDAGSANYELVSAGRTKHAEAVEITYDPSRISYGTLLKVFFSVAHDPTQLNRQGPDRGRQYRSAVFYSNPEQKRIAGAYIRQLTEAHVFRNPIVTEVTPLTRFYPAEERHQRYCRRHPEDPYVVANSQPKVEKLKKEDRDLLKK